MGSTPRFDSRHVHPATLERVRFFPRQLLTADDLSTEQNYWLERQRRHNRLLHGWGVVCGLMVRADTAKGSHVLSVCPGFALSPCGDEIEVPEATPLDLAETLKQAGQPACANIGLAAVAEGGQLSIAIRYRALEAQPVRTLPAGCGCDDLPCEFTRLRDGFELRAAPASTVEAPAEPTLCEIEHDIEQLPASCCAAGVEDWVELARVSLQAVAGGYAPITGKDIDNRVRRLLHPVQRVQRQVIDCCCHRQEP